MYNNDYINGVNAVVKQYMADERVIAIEDTRGGIANKVIKLITDKGSSYILKIYKKKRNHLLANELIDYLASQGFNVVKPINREYIQFEGTVCYLYKYYENAETVICDELEEYILRMLKCISNYKNFEYLPEHMYITKLKNEYNFLKGLSTTKLNKKDIDEVVKLYEEIKDKDINNKLEIVHSDISTSNLLNTKQGYFLIDFDETRVTSKLYDLMVVLIKFYAKEKQIDLVGMKKMTDKYKKIFTEYSDNDYYEAFRYYVCKQLLEKFYDYESGNVDIFSPQQMQDNFQNWVYYMYNIDLFKSVFYKEK